ncbi:MAG: hypothetical protein ACLFR1_15560 [Spirochaetia bacterium]
MTNNKPYMLITTLLFWGGLWGLLEATLGYIFHLIIPFPGFSGMFMFTIGFIMMRAVYEKTGEIWAVPALGAIAAAIKAVNFLFPYLPPIKTWNPMVAIMLEACAAAAFLYLAKGRTWESKPLPVLAMTFGYRVVYMALFLVPVFLLIQNGILKYGPVIALRFLFLDSALNGFLVLGFFSVKAVKEKFLTLARKPIPVFASVLVVAAAVFAEYLL